MSFLSDGLSFGPVPDTHLQYDLCSVSYSRSGIVYWGLGNSDTNDQIENWLECKVMCYDMMIWYDMICVVICYAWAPLFCPFKLIFSSGSAHLTCRASILYQHNQTGTHISIQVWSYLAVFFGFVCFQKILLFLSPSLLFLGSCQRLRAASSQVCQLCPVCALALALPLFSAVRLGHGETKELQQDGSPFSTMAKRSPAARFSGPATTLSLR